MPRRLAAAFAGAGTHRWCRRYAGHAAWRRRQCLRRAPMCRRERRDTSTARSRWCGSARAWPKARGSRRPGAWPRRASAGRPTPASRLRWTLATGACAARQLRWPAMPTGVRLPSATRAARPRSPGPAGARRAPPGRLVPGVRGEAPAIAAASAALLRHDAQAEAVGESDTRVVEVRLESSSPARRWTHARLPSTRSIVRADKRCAGVLLEVRPAPPAPPSKPATPGAITLAEAAAGCARSARRTRYREGYAVPVKSVWPPRGTVLLSQPPACASPSRAVPAVPPPASVYRMYSRRRGAVPSGAGPDGGR